MSKIITGAYLPEQERYENAYYSLPVPGVTYQSRSPEADVIRVERDGKGDHLTLVWSKQLGLYQIVWNGEGVVGVLGFSHQSDAYVVCTTGKLDYSASDGVRQLGELIAESDTLGGAIGEAGLYWIS